MIFSFVRPSENEVAEVHAFPARLAEYIENSVRLLTPGQLHPSSEMVISVRVAEELLHIPYRTYYDKQQLLNCMDSPNEIGAIALCLGTRHYDGFMREKCLHRLLTYDRDWIAPFVLQLLGEYVIEVIQPIHEQFMAGVETKYIVFFRQNPAYCQYLEQRAISYWNEYYRSRYHKPRDYPAVRALMALKEAAASLVGKAI